MSALQSLPDQNVTQTVFSHNSTPQLAEPGIIESVLASVLEKEALALTNLAQNIPKTARVLIDTIISTSGKLVFSGVGKSGLVGRKLAATFSSLGTPSLFLHPSDALHGDVGVIQKQDLFIALSKSGTGAEFETLIPLLQNQEIKTVLISCAHSHLADLADISVVLPFGREACDLNLAPTSSSTLMMAFGDAVAVVKAKLKGFNSNDFARAHPAGVLGKKLLLSVRSIMHQNTELPLLNPETSFTEILYTISSKKLGLGIVIDQEQKLCGIITDGDLRRACQQGRTVFDKTAEQIMVKNPKTITPEILAYSALQVMEFSNITSLVVIEDDKAIGLVHIHDLIKAGLK